MPIKIQLTLLLKENLLTKSLFGKAAYLSVIIWLIKASTYPTSGNRPALDWNGLKIVYGADQVLFVSPKSQDTFLALLKQKNKAIEVVL